MDKEIPREQIAMIHHIGTGTTNCLSCMSIRAASQAQPTRDN